MTTVMPQQAAPARGYRRVPWSPRAWSQALYLAGGIPAQLAAPLIVFALLRWPGRFDFWVGPLFVLWLLVAAVALLLVPVLTWTQRHRLRVTAGIDIPPQPRRPDWLTRDGITETLRSQAYWRQAGYHFLAGPALAAAAIAAIGVWLAGLLFAFEYVYVWTLSPDGALRRGTGGATSSSPLPLLFGSIPADVALTAAGVAGLLVAPFLSSAVASLDARAASALLGPSRAEELQHRVEHLTETRAGVVDAADAERRRLERDLHDGTQQRLVSLAMNLGMARAQASSAEEAQQAIAEAHEEAKAALAELRDLIRGLHPAVLEDRGLDAALSGVAARMPIPVRLTVDGLARRPSPVIEAVAYFVVSEGLANIAKHAQASQAEVFVQRSGDRLHVIVTDDGVGGADPARGTGLTGLARRAQSVDGTFEVVSPPGGPTVLSVDLPCAR
ncbi:MAG TPA: histidine kinase [Streptosporangiaceae bacterium]|nr:histidine kinase [Streptosporangiaceae bacterium]